MHQLKAISGYQFGLFRILLGFYLLWHFYGILPHAAELFSNQGVLAEAAINPTYPFFPNPLYLWDTPRAVEMFVTVLFLAAALLAYGVLRRPAALVLWFGWAALFHRDNLIANPSLPYVGLLLLLTLLIPPGEKLRPKARALPEPSWFVPASVYATAWWLLMAGYTYSGVVKLGSPSWLDGSAFSHVLQNPLARTGWARDLVLALPDGVLQTLTWGALGIELLALPLAFSKRTRPWIWLATLGLQLGILMVVNFTDLTLGMLLIHLFTLDPDWLPARKQSAGSTVVFYDGVCGLCDHTVQFLLEEDRAGILSFAPLQGTTAAALRSRHELPDEMTTVVLVEGFSSRAERVTSYSSGVLGMLDSIGGFWRIVSWLRFVPRPIRDGVYRLVSRHRYRWFGKFDACKLPTADTRDRFLD